MQTLKKNAQPVARQRAKPIKTTFMELLAELTRLTDDDTLVMATMRDIFASYQVRSTRSLAPVRLVRDDSTANAVRLNIRKRSSLWT